MLPHEFLFMLLSKFIAFPDGRLQELKDKMANWVAAQKERKTDDGKPHFIAKIVGHSEQWYVQVLLAIVFLFSVKSIGKWLYENNSDEDVMIDDEYDDIPVNNKKFKLN